MTPLKKILPSHYLPEDNDSPSLVKYYTPSHYLPVNNNSQQVQRKKKPQHCTNSNIMFFYKNTNGMFVALAELYG